MASPPNTATSPPFTPHPSLPTNPKKRPSLPLSPSTTTFKRRKPSAAASATSTSAHPLRQTSFPPEEFSAGLRDLRSPSVESSVAGASVTGAGGGGGSSTRGRGRPRKSGGKGRRDEDGRSVKSGTGKGGTGTRAGSLLDGKSVAGGAGGAGEDGGDGDDEEGDDEAGMVTTSVEGGGEAERAAEKKKMAVLVDAFDRDQQDRYDMYRRVKLKKETVRKITNATLSQSVPPSVITTINGYTKIFIGELIEKARLVQAQESLASASSPTNPHSLTPTSSNPHSQPIATNPTPTQLNAIPQSLTPTSSQPTTTTTTTTGKEPPPPPPGPLLPSHLREALRRYKRSGEGGGVGFGGLSLGNLGVKGAGSARVRGGRLFR
ncbi:hypothetical protein MMC16_005043 [Acarospora aff. strigata]|nr:hypothetical protein [Acarospora aff. strigata]